MPNRSHGKQTVVIVNGTDLSGYCKDSDWNRTPDKHDVTTYGKNDHVYDGGLKDGTTSLSGLYDKSTSTGPRAVLEPLEGTVTTLIYRPEGTGTGLPQRSVSVLCGDYKETHPVNDYVMWTIDLQHSDAVTRTTQP